MYIDMIKMQHQAHTDVQQNNYCLRLCALQQFLPLYFNFNMDNYARCCVYYAEVLSQIGTFYPGLKDTLNSKGPKTASLFKQLSTKGGNKLLTVMEKLVVVSEMLPLRHHLYLNRV